MHNRTAALVIIMSIAASLALAGCNNPTTQSGNPGSTSTTSVATSSVNTSQSAVTTASKVPFAVGQTGNVPSGFPQSFPLYSGVRASNTTGTATTNIYQVQLFTTDTVAVALKNYAAKLKADGFTVKAQGTTKLQGLERGYLAYQKGTMSGFVSFTQTSAKGGETRMVARVVTPK